MSPTAGAGSHRFDHRKRELFGSRRQREDVEQAQKRFRLRNETRQVNAMRNVGCFGCIADCVALRPVTDDHQMPFFRQARDRAHKRGLVLYRAQSGEAADPLFAFVFDNAA